MITFQTENIEMPAIDQDKVRKWIKAVAASYQKRVGNITYSFCDDEKILAVNCEYLQHDYYTDIITFDYCEGNRLSGDLFISLDTVRSNAEMLHTDYNTELHRVIIHGVLHLLGQGDKTDPEAAEMRRQEEEALSLWNTMFPVEQIG